MNLLARSWSEHQFPILGEEPIFNSAGPLAPPAVRGKGLRPWRSSREVSIGLPLSPVIGIPEGAKHHGPDVHTSEQSPYTSTMFIDERLCKPGLGIEIEFHIDWNIQPFKTVPLADTTLES